MTNINTLKESARFALNKEYGFAPEVEAIEIVNVSSDKMSFYFTVGNHKYAYNYRSDLDSPITKLDGKEWEYQQEAKKYYAKWLAVIA